MTRKGINYDPITICLHWIVAIAVFTLFGLGLWMVELDYYDPWYKKAPDIHRAIGICVFLAMLLRLVWRLARPAPGPVRGLATWERRASAVVHWSFYLLVPLTALAGYLMSTADGRGVDVFNLFEVPATITSFANQEDVAGKIHWYLAVVLICVAALHGLAALKHHIVDRDQTLRRMLGIGKEEE